MSSLCRAARFPGPAADPSSRRARVAISPASWVTKRSRSVDKRWLVVTPPPGLEIAALVVSCFGLLLQLNVITLHLRYARTAVWAAIAVCAALAWMREGSKAASTVAASMVFVSALTVALSLRLLH